VNELWLHKKREEKEESKNKKMSKKVTAKDVDEGFE
tara:strand:+ start:350 stop:457 length:108 start_codon:yes stop_codon:yes gene_type:complete